MIIPRLSLFCSGHTPAGAICVAKERGRLPRSFQSLAMTFYRSLRCSSPQGSHADTPGRHLRGPDTPLLTEEGIKGWCSNRCHAGLDPASRKPPDRCPGRHLCAATGVARYRASTIFLYTSLFNTKNKSSPGCLSDPADSSASAPSPKKRSIRPAPLMAPP